MKRAYWIVRGDVADAEAFTQYTSRTPAALAKFGGQFLVRAGQFEAVEGPTRSRHTLIEFPSYEQALACWNSPEYQEARSHRLDAAEVDIVIVEGVDR